MDFLTGSSGFLGQHLYHALLQQNRTVATIPHELISLSSLKPFDHFYFLSSYGNLYQQTDLEKTIQANLLDLVHMIREAAEYPFKSFVYISTSSVKLEVQTAYSRMKHAAEEVLLTYMEKYKLPICIIRPMSITGVGEQDQHLIPTLIRSCLTGEKMKFVPKATHDFIDVDDVVSAILNLSEHSRYGIFEVGWGNRVTNQKVLELVEKVTGKKANIEVVENLRPYDNFQWFSTNYKVRSWGWLPTKPLEQSIREMVDDYA